MLELLALADHRVQIGINNTSNPDRHGTATLRGGKIPFTVDKPGKLKSPKDSTVRSIFEQFEKLELPVQNIELVVGKRRRVYTLVNGIPTLVQSVSI